MTARRVAIVGLGPKGFGCLERLALEVARSPRPVEFEVTVYDPVPHPGAGPIYDPAQPSDLLLNFAARHVDVWSVDNDLVPASQRLDLVRWLERHEPAWASADAYVPRRFVGHYLREAYAALVAALPASLRLTHVPAVVDDLVPVGRGWRIHTAGVDAGAAGGDPAVVDEVVITTGHGTWTSDRGADAWADALPAAGGTRVVRTVLPVASALGPTAVPAAATVGMRGFALTFIDAALALTAGRGGRFEGLDGPQPRYEGTEQDVARILPYSRSGLPLQAKPGPELTRRAGALAPIWAEVGATIRAARDLTVDDVCCWLAGGASRALRHLCPAARPTAAAEVHATMVALTSTPPPFAAAEPATAGGRSTAAWGTVTRAAGTATANATIKTMCRSVAVAQCRRPPDARFAVAEAWRQVYPALVERVSHGGLPAAELPSFRHLAQGMERLAFGPPAEHLARIGALLHAGVVDLRLVRAPKVTTVDGRLALAAAEGTADPSRPVAPVPLDVLVNAVIAPPGMHQDTPLLWRLRGRGAVRTAVGGGLEVDRSAACVGGDGAATPGLSAVGRATELWVLGNDTLSRRLHPETAAWARRIVAGANGEPTVGPDPARVVASSATG